MCADDFFWYDNKLVLTGENTLLAGTYLRASLIADDDFLRGSL